MCENQVFIHLPASNQDNTTQHNTNTTDQQKQIRRTKRKKYRVIGKIYFSEYNQLSLSDCIIFPMRGDMHSSPTLMTLTTPPKSSKA